MARIVPLPQSPSALPLRRDLLALALFGAATIALISLILWLVAAFSSIPENLPMHFDALGRPERIGDRRELFTLPAIGAGVYLLNILGGLVLRQRRRMVFACYLLWSGALVVQLLMWLGMWNLTH